MGRDPIKCGDEGVDLGLASIQLFRDQQPIRCVVRPQRERVDAAVRLPCRQATPEVGIDACGGLVPVLSGLGQELQDDGGDRTRKSAHPLARRHRLPGDVTMDPLQWIRGRQRQRPGEHLVQRDAEGVEIAAGIDRAVHAAGLLRRHVSKRAGNNLWWRGRLAFARQPRRNA